jgi:hypothetical protein
MEPPSRGRTSLISLPRRFCTLLLALVVAATVLTGTYMAGTSEAAVAVCQKMVIPAYFNPGAAWTQAISGGSSVGIMIMNPNSGPGTRRDASYAAYVNSAKATGVKVLGYVHTSYGARNAGIVRAEVDLYKTWYGVTDVFFDETSGDTGHLGYYQSLANYVHTTPGSTVMLNPGTVPDESYMNVGDIVAIFESDYAAYTHWQAPSWVNNYPSSKIYNLVYGAPNATAMANALALARNRNAGYAYVTNDVLPNPWDTLPSYFSSELTQLAQSCSSDTAAPGVSITTPSHGAVVSGTVNATISATDDVGVTKVEYYLDGALANTATTAPYSWAWNTTASSNASHSLVAKAYDAAGNVGTSSAVTVSVSNSSGTADVIPPQVQISSPTNSSTIRNSVLVSASASDNVKVTRIEVYVDGALKAKSTASSITYTWSARNTASGSHVVAVRAYDAAGNSAASSVTVYR